MRDRYKVLNLNLSRSTIDVPKWERKANRLHAAETSQPSALGFQYSYITYHTGAFTLYRGVRAYSNAYYSGSTGINY
jgi:hypothetical protein